MSENRTFFGTLARGFLFYKYSFVVVCKLLGGRWFVYRDMPMWFVAEVATMRDETGDDLIGRMIKGAEEELTSRVTALTRAAAAVGETIKGNGNV